ncbi:MAG: hypothetical protein FJ387_07235 [Verrucomicrobia bacterium]|nr:hypothetical protein [Verrucomicrobiota bacterium]
MIEVSIQLAFAALTAAIGLALIRLARGPTVIDRILAFDTIAVCAVGMIVLLSILWRTTFYLELILIFSLLGFTGAVAYVYYLSRTDNGDPTSEEAPSPNHRPDRD